MPPFVDETMRREGTENIAAFPATEKNSNLQKVTLIQARTSKTRAMKTRSR
jgi:hypothetical protein